MASTIFERKQSFISKPDVKGGGIFNRAVNFAENSSPKEATVAIDPAFFERFEGFKGFSKRQLAKMKDICEEVVFNENGRLFCEGDPATHLWLIAEGNVDLRFEMPDMRETTKEQTVSSVSVKPKKAVAKTLGWSCFVPPYKMRLSAYCVSRRCRFVRISKEDLLELFEEDRLMGYRFMSYMVTVVGYRFHQFQDVVANTIGNTMLTGW
jgi:CRP-like cAMP-binding protein